MRDAEYGSFSGQDLIRPARLAGRECTHAAFRFEDATHLSRRNARIARMLPLGLTLGDPRSNPIVPKFLRSDDERMLDSRA
jgi:hypothetical protein